MSVIDASIWVALCHAGDRHHKRTLGWFQGRLAEDEPLAAPSLLRVEVAAAIRRLTGSKELADEAVQALDRHDWVEFVDLDAGRSRRAAEIATVTGVRGADAVYLELSAQRGEVLVTWDRQQLDRGSAVARVETP